MSMDLVIGVVIGFFLLILIAYLFGRGGTGEQDFSVSGESAGSFHTPKAGARRRGQGRSADGSGAPGTFNDILDTGMADTYLPSVQQVWGKLDDATKEKLGMVIGPEFARQMTELTAMKGESIGVRQRLEDGNKLHLIELRLAGNSLITTAKAKTALFQEIERAIREVEAIEDKTTRGFALISVCDEIAHFMSENMYTVGQIGVAHVLRLYASTRPGQIQKPQTFQEAIEDTMFSGVTTPDTATGEGEYEKLFDLYRGVDENPNGRRLADG